ncbi:MAG: AAA family ATPase [Chloroflexi bacterium]|nr:AAA family ATPase [Chloroflexota bacterium]
MITLTIERSLSEYASSSKCLCYVDADAMAREGLAVGDVIRIQTFGERAVLARLAEALGEDRGRGVIRIDRFTRQAAKARLNETVEVRRCKLEPVKSVVLQPAADVSAAIGHELERHLKDTLIANEAPICIGSVVYVNFPNSVAGTAYKVVRMEGGPGIVGEETKVRIEVAAESVLTELALDVTFEDVGGLSREIVLVRELVQMPLQFPYVYRQLGIGAPKGIIFYGPPGTGKTHLARAVANEIRAQFFYINGPDIVGTVHGETEGNLRRMFAEATHHAPSVIFIDELDAIAPKRGESGAHSDTRAVTQLLSLLDGLRRVDGVIVIGTTNRIEAIDTALRRPGRFDREIFIGPPDARGRLEILQIHTREMPLSGDALDALPEMARITPGFVGADLMELCREAGLRALRRCSEITRGHLYALRVDVATVSVEREDFEGALAHIRPSALREVLVKVPDVGWDDIGGLRDEKARLRSLVDLSLHHQSTLASLDVSPAKGILLVGAPGTGKTMLAQAVAGSCGVNFLPVDGPEIFTKWLGESEEAVRHIFRLAGQLAPAIVFFDQLDAIAPVRGQRIESATTQRVVSQLLTELDAVDSRSNIVVLAATNRPDLVDPAVLRPGRFSLHLELPLPDLAARREILDIHLRSIRRVDDRELVVDLLAKETEGFSGADLKQLCDHAKLICLDIVADGAQPVLARQHFLVALHAMKPQWLKKSLTKHVRRVKYSHELRRTNKPVRGVSG